MTLSNYRIIPISNPEMCRSGLSDAIVLHKATESGDKAFYSGAARFSLSNIYRSWNIIGRRQTDGHGHKQQ